ncbi:hypothetical protein OOU_Y34scaffold00683g2 [Pyricularia oryzae Y34]|uniref:Uncharacterized protein n=2 Tax=Pyricularia oryzae TaxID=318829 RepID=A0AA97NT73_PYRO3|nr:hypothetical protein OOU_Y34scaffold00683g2 [Pyricularia oryzae Y34]KAI6483711.1 hypothetical protein MCOR11_010424 [Pyricularia oryzae]KAI6593663.1 hypothetical protein MCOR12_007206 [Pyricularia oryzae]
MWWHVAKTWAARQLLWKAGRSPGTQSWKEERRVDAIPYSFKLPMMATILEVRIVQNLGLGLRSASCNHKRLLIAFKKLFPAIKTQLYRDQHEKINRKIYKQRVRPGPSTHPYLAYSHSSQPQGSLHKFGRTPQSIDFNEKLRQKLQLQRCPSSKKAHSELFIDSGDSFVD